MGKVTVDPGAVASIQITLDPALTVASAGFKVVFDPSLGLTDTDVVAAPFLGDATKGASIGNGSVLLSATFSKNKTGWGTIWTLNFHVPANAPRGKSYPISIAANDRATFAIIDENGTDVPVQIADGSIGVTALNHPPVATDGSVTTTQETPVSIVLKATDEDGDPLTYSIVSGPSKGKLSGAIPNLTYTPDAGSTGPDSFTFKANDGKADSNVATVSISVSKKILAPTAANGSVTTDQGKAAGVTLSATDPQSLPLTYSVVTQPANGSLSGTAPNLTYTPNAGFTGSDSFTFKANNGTLDSNVATVSITVRAPLSITPPTVSLGQGQTQQFTVSPTGPVSWSVDGEGKIDSNGLYTAPASIATSHTSTVIATDSSQRQARATVTLTPPSPPNGTLSVQSANGVPGGTAAITLNVDSLTLAGLQAKVTYPTDLTLADADVTGGTLFNTSQITPNTQTKGTAYLAIAGNKNVQGPGSVATLTFHIPATAQGGTTYPITLSEASSNDQDGKTTQLSVQAGSIKVQPKPPVAANGSVTTDAGKAVSITLSATDPQNLPLTYSVVTQPVSGSLSGTAPNLTYTPNAGSTGSDSFTFQANNGTLDSNVATVSITVRAPLTISPSTVSLGQGQTQQFTVSPAGTAVSWSVDGEGKVDANGLYTAPASITAQHAATAIATETSQPQRQARATVTLTPPPPIGKVPVAQDQVVKTLAGVFVPISLSATGTGPLTYTVVAGPPHGTLSGTPPNLIYTPNPGYVGSDVLTFKASNAAGDSNFATVSISVMPAPPIANNGSAKTDGGQAVLVAVSATDPQGLPLTYSVVAQPSHGGLSGTAPNFTYTPAANFSGSDSFTFRANNGTLDSNIATVSITVNAPPSPVARDASVTTTQEKPIAVTLAAVDPNGLPLSYAVVTGPSNASLTGTAPNLTLMPKAGFSGADRFTFKANNGYSDSNVAAVSIVVIGLPTAANQTLTTAAGKAVAVTLSASDPQGLRLTYGTVTQPAQGVLSGTAPNLTYTPAAGFSGLDSFTFKANNGTLDSNVATVSIKIIPAAPIAIDGSAKTDAGQAVPVTLSARDPQGLPLTFSVVAQSSHGGLSGTAPNLTYTPAAGFNGSDSFTFKTNNGTLDSNLGTVSITVRAPLTIKPPAPTLKAGRTVQFTVDPQVPVTWVVTAGDGTLTSTGFFTAPTKVSVDHTVTVSATDADGRTVETKVQLQRDLPEGSLKIGSLVGLPGQFVTIDLLAGSDLAPFQTLTAILDYPTELLTYDETRKPDLADSILGTAVANVDASTPGSLSIRLTGTTNTTGAGVIAHLPFRVVAPVSVGTESNLVLSGLALRDVNGAAVPFHGENGKITIGRLLGDLTGDGKVNIGDVTMLLQFVVKLKTPTPEQLAAGDLDHDGSLDIKDVTALLKAVVTGTVGQLK